MRPYDDICAMFEEAILKAPTPDCPSLIGELERLKALVLGRMMTTQPASTAPISPVENGRYLTVEEVAARFGVTDRWLYRHKKQMPHSQPSRKVLLFPEQAITKWFASRKGA